MYSAVFNSYLTCLRSRWLCCFRGDCIEGDSPTRLAMVHHISPLIVNNHVPCIPRSVHAVPLCDGGILRLDVIDWFAGWLVTHNNPSDNTMLMAVGFWSGWWALIDSYKTNLRKSDWYFYIHAGPSSSLIPYPFRLFVQVWSKVLSGWNSDYYGMRKKITEFVQCEAVKFGRNVTTFQRNLVPTPFMLKKITAAFKLQTAGHGFRTSSVHNTIWGFKFQKVTVLKYHDDDDDDDE